MQDEPSIAQIRLPGPFAPLLAWVLGTALQLQQATLFPVWCYGAMAAVAVLGLVVCWRGQTAARLAGLLLCCAALGFAATGLRCQIFAASALEPALEGQDLRIVGVVTDMPQRSEAGLRFSLACESAQLAGRAVTVPPRMDVGWYSAGNCPGGESTAAMADVRAGERWELTLRLKAPHGSSNPHGFDYELWLWERGVQATAYVRAGPRDAAPRRLGQTLRYPLALLRQGVRERIFDGLEPRGVAGLVAALVVGDQTAIERSDWDVFRATGVAHLVSISGLHHHVCLGCFLGHRAAVAALGAPVPALARTFRGTAGGCAAGQRLCAVFGLGPAGAAHLPDAGHGGRAAPCRAALALAAHLDAGLRLRGGL
jgi:competence protein ComEC